jgi:hypothetical protein
MAHLVSESGPLEGQVFPVGVGLTIGREPHNTIAMPDNRHASREHCKVWKDGAKTYAIADFGSTNGTLLNDEKVVRHAIVPGDRIRIGDIIFRFELDEDEKPKPKTAQSPTGARPDLAAILKGEVGPSKAPTRASEGGETAGQIEIKQRVLQYQKKGKRGSILSWDFEQMAGPVKWLVVLLIGAAAVGLFLVAKNLATGDREPERPIEAPTD